MAIRQLLPNNFFGTYYGLINNDEDAARVIEGCVQNKLPLIKARLKEHRRKDIDGGYVFVFKSNGSSKNDTIQRWTDGKLWSPSKILDNFLIYCELIANYKPISQNNLEYHPDDIKEMEELDEMSKNQNNEIGVISKRYWIDNQKGIFIPKIDGLIKKTITIALESESYHLIAYEFAQLPSNHPYPLLTPENYLELNSLNVEYLKQNRFKKN